MNDLEERSKLLQRALTRDALTAVALSVMGSFAVLALRALQVPFANWVGVGSLVLTVLLASLWVARRRKSWVQKLGLSCDSCGRGLADTDGTLLLRAGSCPNCGRSASPVGGSGESIARPGRGAVRMDPSRQAELRKRLAGYRRYVARDVVVAIVACVSAFGAGEIAANEWKHVPWVDKAVPVVIVFVLLLSLVVLYLRWKGLEARFGLICPRCSHVLVGGEHDELTRAISATGQCSNCGALIF